MDFGAFVEIAPGKEGLVHISRLDVKRTEKVTDVVNVDDEVLVKVLEIDDKGCLLYTSRSAAGTERTPEQAGHRLASAHRILPPGGRVRD